MQELSEVAVITHDSIDDGDGRYASRTRVNRLVVEIPAADYRTLPMYETEAIPLNGEVHTIKLDLGTCQATTASDAETDKGRFQMVNSELTLAGEHENYFTPIDGIDYTGQAQLFYQFQTNEGAAQNGTTMDIALSVRTGVSGHSSSPSAPKVADAGGTDRVIGTVQPWTGRVAGSVKFVLSFSGGSSNTFHADTGPIKIIVYYS